MFVLKKKLIHDYQLMLLGLNGECFLLRNCAIIVPVSYTHLTLPTILLV